MMLSLNQILLVIIVLTVAGQYETFGSVLDPLDTDDIDRDTNARPLPPELVAMMTNKTGQTEMEQLVENCMSDYAVCIGLQEELVFCGVDENGAVTRTFYSLCEMIYENCKARSRIWEYLRDEECDPK